MRISDAWAGFVERRGPRESPFRAALARAVEAGGGESVLTLVLGARHLRFRGVVLVVRLPRFWGGVAVVARLDPPPGQAGAPLAWSHHGEGVLYRIESGGEVRESLRVDVAGRHRVIRLRIRNRDDAPLPVAGATVMAAVERIAFEAAPGRRYRLSYGDPRRTSPSYDLARTAGDPALFAARARETALGPPVHAPADLAEVPWTERNPALLWGGLVAVVLALGVLTRQALRTA
jgi:hypothetical protein